MIPNLTSNIGKIQRAQNEALRIATLKKSISIRIVQRMQHKISMYNQYLTSHMHFEGKIDLMDCNNGLLELKVNHLLEMYNEIRVLNELLIYCSNRCIMKYRCTQNIITHINTPNKYTDKTCNNHTHKTRNNHTHKTCNNHTHKTCNNHTHKTRNNHTDKTHKIQVINTNK